MVVVLLHTMHCIDSNWQQTHKYESSINNEYTQPQLICCWLIYMNNTTTTTTSTTKIKMQERHTNYEIPTHEITFLLWQKDYIIFTNKGQYDGKMSFPMKGANIEWRVQEVMDAFCYKWHLYCFTFIGWVHICRGTWLCAVGIKLFLFVVCEAHAISIYDENADRKFIKFC